MSFALPKIDSKRRVSICVPLFVFFLFAGAGKSSAQDLGALARQEQARKSAQPVHTVHVYTNDDLARPHILVPEENVKLEAARRKLPPSLMLLAPAAEPEPEVHAQEISLGEVARKYREEKLARESRPVRPVQLASAPHVYTNDDMARPKILTAEDDARYLAALKKPVAVPAQLIVPDIETAGPVVIAVSAEKENESAPAESLHPASTISEIPLGDIARVAYQQQHPPEPIFSVRGPAPSRYAWRRKLVAYRTSRRAQPAPGIFSVVDLPERRRVESPSDLPEARRNQTLTVRSGDSLWKLAHEHFGRGGRWRDFLKANPWITNPNRLRVGAQIRI